VPTRVLVHLHVVISKSALFVGQRAIDQHFELLDCERLKSKNLRPRHECAIYVKERVVSSGADETKSPGLDVWQENVLLCLVEMMDLINEQDCLSPGRAQTIHGCSDDSAHLGDIAFHAADPDEFCVRHLRNDPGQGGLAGARRSGENHRRQSIGFNGTAQQLARCQDVLLADEFIERVRTHARGKRRTIGAHAFDIFVISEKILHEGNYGAPVTQAIVSAIGTDSSRGEPASPGKAHRIACIRRARLCVMILRSRDASVRLDGTTMKCILVPIDFSDVTPPVIDVARQLAKALDAEIHLVHVKEFTAAATPGTLGYGLAGMPELAPMSGAPVPGFESAPETIPEDEGQTLQLAKWQEEIAQDGIKVSLQEPTGLVAEEILNQADELNADMIVMGTHGHGAMYNLLVGSATKGVLKHSTHPVLLVPAPKSS